MYVWTSVRLQILWHCNWYLRNNSYAYSLKKYSKYMRWMAWMACMYVCMYVRHMNGWMAEWHKQNRRNKRMENFYFKGWNCILYSVYFKHTHTYTHAHIHNSIVWFICRMNRGNRQVTSVVGVVCIMHL